LPVVDRRIEPPVITDEVVAALRRIIRAIDLQSRALVQQCGLTGPQLQLLKELGRRDDRGLGEVARALHLSQATITGIVDRLEAKKLISRLRDPTDKRRIRVVLTDSGKQLLESAPPVLQEHFTAALQGLADWEQHQILSSLQRVVALMEARELETSPFLATGPLDASSESLESFLDPENDP
jgi:DNA-binding MarR family transcriptional regulator